jgi:rhamnogalacturonan endolyase
MRRLVIGATPALQADLIGDWREEVVWRSADNRELRIYTTPYWAAPRVSLRCVGRLGHA